MSSALTTKKASITSPPLFFAATLYIYDSKYRTNTLFAVCMSIAGIMDPVAAVRSDKTMPQKRYMGSLTGLKWSIENVSDDIITAQEAPHGEYSASTMPRNRNSSRSAGSTPKASAV